MKRKRAANIVPMHEQYPFKNSPQSLTLECEIKRIATEREESIDQTIKKLADLSDVSERQIYNYRTGKTDIPSGLIPVFCNQFQSNALAMAILQQCEQCEEFEAFDIVQLANQSAQETLEVHQHFLKVFNDGQVTGFEYNESKRKTANAVAHFHRLDQVVEGAYNRRRVA